jgi:hypothetical protein
MTPVPHAAVDFIIENSSKYGKAKGTRVYIEGFLKSKKAMLMILAKLKGVTSVTAQERDAYADAEYIQLLQGLSVAVEDEETLRWKLEAAKLRIEVFKIESFMNRQQDKLLT